MDLPELKIGHLLAKVPIVQGGMGVGISLSSLGRKCGIKRRHRRNFRS